MLLGMPSSSAVTTGTVFCGTVGSNSRCDYCAVGDVVNQSARLMTKASGSILIDENTHYRLPEELKWRFTEGLPLALKGNPKPVTPFVYDLGGYPQVDNIIQQGVRSNFSSNLSSAFIPKVVREAFTEMESS